MARLACRIGQLAHDIHAVQALGRVGRMAAGLRNCQWRQRFENADDRYYGGACTSTRCWCQKKEGPQAIGRSRGGWTSKIHVVVDALGSPVRWLLTGGEVAHITQAKSLLEGLKASDCTHLTAPGFPWRSPVRQRSRPRAACRSITSSRRARHRTCAPESRPAWQPSG